MAQNDADCIPNGKMTKVLLVTHLWGLVFNHMKELFVIHALFF